MVRINGDGEMLYRFVVPRVRFPFDQRQEHGHWPHWPQPKQEVRESRTSGPSAHSQKIGTVTVVNGYNIREFKKLRQLRHLKKITLSCSKCLMIIPNSFYYTIWAKCPITGD